MTVVVSICALILAAAIIIGLVRVLTARDLGSRAVEIGRASCRERV